MVTDNRVVATQRNPGCRKMRADAGGVLVTAADACVCTVSEYGCIREGFRAYDRTAARLEGTFCAAATFALPLGYGWVGWRCRSGACVGADGDIAGW
jgi:hypothetical protein